MEDKEKLKTPEEAAGDAEDAAENNDGQDGISPNADILSDGEGEPIVALPMAEYDQLKEELAAAQKEAAANLDSWQRAVADYNNLRRRTQVEREQMHAELTVKILTPFLDVLDDLELAVQNRPAETQDQAWGDGIELVYRKLVSKLSAANVSVMDAEGQDFDPHFHEAITHEDNDEFKSGQIIAVVKPGYMIGDRVLRPAMVRVAA